jgi:hypothetical protein
MTAKFQFDLSELRDALPHATPRERAAAEALLEHGTGVPAAEALGITTSALHQRIKALRQRAALANTGAPPPDGFRVTKVAQRGDGTVIAVQSRPEGDPDAHLPTIPDGHLIRGLSTLLGSDGTVTAQWVKTDRQAQAKVEAFAEAIRGLAQSVMPAPPVDAPPSVDSDLCTILPWGDPHVGALSWAAETGHSWDLKIAEECTVQVLADLISRTPRSEEFLLVDLGDLFHAEDDRQVTPTAGHKLDVDSRASKIVRVALRMFRTAIDLALQRHANVRVRLLRGNHDPYKSVAAGLWLEQAYQFEPRVTIEPFDDPYQFWQFGECGFMWHHGDGSKPQQMPQIFACHDVWRQTQHRYIQTGHIHSQNRWDQPGCETESFRTAFPGDFWSHWKGYRSKRTLDAITYHRTHGEVSRLQQGVRR